MHGAPADLRTPLSSASRIALAIVVSIGLDGASELPPRFEAKSLHVFLRFRGPGSSGTRS